MRTGQRNYAMMASAAIILIAAVGYLSDADRHTKGARRPGPMGPEHLFPAEAPISGAQFPMPFSLPATQSDSLEIFAPISPGDGRYLLNDPTNPLPLVEWPSWPGTLIDSRFQPSQKVDDPE
jgi:hypothetical protein